MINQMAIIGLGFMGMSIARAIKDASFTKSIVGYDKNIQKAQDLARKKIIHHSANDLKSAIKHAELIVIATDFNQYDEIFSVLATDANENATITELGSVKSSIIELAKAKLGEAFQRFVASHPIVYIQQNQNRLKLMPDIFAERPVIITPVAENKQKSINLVIQLWQKMGGVIEIKSPAENDTILATISHLPQILAFTFINSLRENNTNLRYISKNFIDFTSIATESPIIWSDTCIANRQAILKELTRFESNLRKLKKILEAENLETLLEHFNNAKQLRENI